MSEDVQLGSSGVLLLYHCRANTGYAIGSLEKAFWAAALKICGNKNRIFLCYTSYESGRPIYLPEGFNNYYEFDPSTQCLQQLKKFESFIQDNQIELLMGFDQPPNMAYYKAARRAGVRRIVSYWGAPMSSLNSGFRLWLKRLEVALYSRGPDLYIFESRAMQETAYNGRGVPKHKTAVCYLGVDPQRFFPDEGDKYYAHSSFDINLDQKLIFYSGHFEPRKGVEVIVKAANAIARSRSDITFILFGNQPGEEAPYDAMLTEEARKHVVFGGYRSDLPRIHRSCHAGVIASIGWDSFTVSSLEMQASGLPLLVSNLPGLNETVERGVTGELFPGGDDSKLAQLVCDIVDDEPKRKRMSQTARNRVKRTFNVANQIESLANLLTDTKFQAKRI